jgi:hypothetical protein
VEIRAIPPRPERRQGLVAVLTVAWWLDFLAGGPVHWFGGVGEERGSRQTRVVVRYHGREHLLFEEIRFELAESKCERVAQEYESMDLRAWCHRYRVPEQFFVD